MFNATEDDDSFYPSLSSNLSSLFGTSMTLQTNYESNLSYTAPKQPKVQEKSPKPQSSVFCSKFVDAFKLINNEQVNQGKCGIAVIGSDALNAREVILYKSKQDIIARIKLNASFILHRQSNNFASFCDDQQQRWSVHFENLKEIEEFSKELQLHGGQIVLESIKKTELIKQDKDSDSLSDASTSKTKANILSRMAKMGQSILPKADVTPSDSDNSDSEEKTIVKKIKKVRQQKDKVSGDQTINLPNSQPEFVLLNGKPVQLSTLQPNLNLPMLNQPYWNHPQPISVDPLNIFIAENRTHNCEMRMNISQLSAKLDKIFEQVTRTKPVVPAYTLNTNKINQNTNYVEDITKLEEEYKLLLIKLRNANELVNTLTVENDTRAITITEQEKKIDELQKEMIKCQDLQQQIDEQRKTITELQETLANQKPNLEMLTEFYEEHKSNDLNSKVIEELSESNSKLKMKLANNSEKKDLFSKKLKQAMNSLYQTMMETFSDQNASFPASEIKEILSKNLKTTTFNVIEEFNNDFKDTEELENVPLPPVPN